LNLHATPVMQPGCAYPAGLSTVAPDYRSGVSTSFTIAPFEEPSPEGLLGQPGPAPKRVALLATRNRQGHCDLPISSMRPGLYQSLLPLHGW
jgi:hypothetical protein